VPSQIFSIVNPLALSGWVLLIVFPGRAWARLVAGRLIPILLALIYVAIVGCRWWGAPGGFSSLAAVAELFGDQWLLLGGWVHYLAFDLFVGSWIVQDASKRGIVHVWVIPPLLLTFMFGPAGWLVYQCLTAVLPREAPAGNP
jgi:hypothetical protein